MTNRSSLPKELNQIIQNEQIDFLVKSKRKRPLKDGIYTLFFGVFWIFILLFGYYQVSFKNTTQLNLDNLFNLINKIDFSNPKFQLIILFIVIGILTITYGIFQIFQKGSYFVGTPNALIQYRNGKIKITDWNQFSGNIEFKNKGLLGNLSLELLSGKYVKKSNSNSRYYVSDFIHMIGIENATDIYSKCKSKISEKIKKENLEVQF